MANVIIDKSYTLKQIFEELCKGNISIITLEVKRYISDMALWLYNPASAIDNDYNENLKYLILICNILYNRTSTSVLPVEDGLYDILLERYKSIDPNFQVGSVVVQFSDMIEKDLSARGEKKAICPFIVIDKKPKDDLHQHFEDELTKFDKFDVVNSYDIMYANDNSQPNTIVSKRMHNTQHNHPDLVGTLDKCKFIFDADAIEKDAFTDDRVKILERDWFRKHIDAGIITEDQELTMVVELKYDGISVEADCTDQVISARTRGDTGIGEAADLTPILQGYRFTRNQVLKDREVGVKFEAIMTKDNLIAFNQARNYTYANCRTAIIGLFGASDASLYRDYITLVPLALDRKDVPEVTNRLEEIELLNRVYKTKCQPLRYSVITGNYKTCLYLIKIFAEEAVAARDYLNFMFDGIVVSYVDEDIREKLGRKNFINKYQMAVKFDPLTKQTTFLGYTYEIGQNGAVCPMIHYSPVEFFGTIHNKSTGSSYKRFRDLNLKPGDIIQVTYTNDVMPYVSSIDCEQNRQNPESPIEFPDVCPICGTKLEIQSTGKTVICPNLDCAGRKVSRMTNMLQKLNLKGFAESTIQQLNIFTFHELFSLTEEELLILGPTNASNMYSSMQLLMNTPTEDYRLIGSLGFTNIAAKTWKIIFSKYTLRDLLSAIEFDKSHLYMDLCSLPGIGEATVKSIFNEYEFFKDDMVFILNHFNIIDSMNVTLGKQIRFTGCRNKEFENYLRSLGHDADGNAGVTKSTDILVIPYNGFTSTKTAKASDSTILVAIGEFMEDPERYL